MPREARVDWFIRHRDCLKHRSFLIGIFTETEYEFIEPLDIGRINETITVNKELINKQLKRTSDLAYKEIISDYTYILGLDNVSDTEYHFVVIGRLGAPVFSIYEELEITSDDIENYTGKSPMVTTYGRYIWNYLILSVPFNDKIEFVNGEYNIGKIEKQIANLILAGKISNVEHDLYMNYIFFIGTFTEISSPTLTERSLTTDPRIPQRKEELLKKHAHELDNPIVCAKIEDELISMDKEYLKDDPSYGFYGYSGKKFNVHRKKQLITVGLTEAFSKDKGEYAFIEESLSDGWRKESLPAICDEIRRGSYNRGKETAQGGELSKYLLRLFQNTKITEQNCGTSRGLTFQLTPDIAHKFYGRTIVGKGKLVTLNESNVSLYLNKIITLRSLMYCQTKHGYCYTCAGEMYKSLGTEAIGVLALEIGSTFLLLSMKSMHGTKMESIDLKDITEFFV